MTDEVRQEDREAADDVFDALSERYGVPAVYRTALANDFAAHASPLRTRIAELEGEKDRLEVAVGWLADVSAATAYSAAELKSTSKAERNRQAVIMEKVIVRLVDGNPSPTGYPEPVTGMRSEKVPTAHPLPKSADRRDCTRV